MASSVLWQCVACFMLVVPAWHVNAQANHTAGPMHVSFAFDATTLQHAFKDGVPHVVIMEHIDMQGVEPKDCNLCALLVPASELLSVQGACSKPPPEAPPGGLPLYPLSEQQCVLTHNAPLFTFSRDIPEGVWLTRLYLKSVAVGSNPSATSIQFASDGAAYLEQVTFQGSSRDSHALALTVGGNHVVFLEECTFVDLYHSVYVPAVNLFGSASFERCSFVSVTAGPAYGAILMQENDTAVRVVETSFTDVQPLGIARLENASGIAYVDDEAAQFVAETVDAFSAADAPPALTAADEWVTARRQAAGEVLLMAPSALPPETRLDSQGSTSRRRVALIAAAIVVTAVAFVACVLMFSFLRRGKKSELGWPVPDEPTPDKGGATSAKGGPPDRPHKRPPPEKQAVPVPVKSKVVAGGEGIPDDSVELAFSFPDGLGGQTNSTGLRAISGGIKGKA